MKLLQWESRVSLIYKDNIIEHSAPNRTVIDNGKALISNKFKNINCKYSISNGNTVPYYQRQNSTEGESGNF